ncbi:putative GGDEF domain-containing protein [Azospirillaceae bacterium]
MKMVDDYVYKKLFAIRKGGRKPTGAQLVKFVALTLLIIITDIIAPFDIKMGPCYILLCFYITLHGTEAIYLYIVSGMSALYVIHEVITAPFEGVDYYAVFINVSLNVSAIVCVIIIMSAFHRSIKFALSANIDPLTELFGRRYINDIMPVIISDLRRNNRAMSMMFLDCDNFKSVNDMLGHAAGDAVLRVVARTILETVRDNDLPARLGGDEFIVIFLDATGNELKSVVDRCIGKLNNEMKLREWPITFSVGVVEFTSTPLNIEVATKQADDAMYRAKKGGKNRIVYELAA